MKDELIQIHTAAEHGREFIHETVNRIIHEFSESFGNAIDAKDHCTKSHSVEVAEAAKELAAQYGMGDDFVRNIHIAGHLHDVGKIGVPDRVLSKRGPLTSAEWELMSAHSAIGAMILRPVGVLARAGIPEMVLHHHERWDGAGYPHGLRGLDIPLGSRIIAVADSLSAMLQSRPYRPPMRFAEAALEIRRCSGAQFDPGAVEAFIAIEQRLEALMETLRREEEARAVSEARQFMDAAEREMRFSG